MIKVRLREWLMIVVWVVLLVQGQKKCFVYMWIKKILFSYSVYHDIILLKISVSYMYSHIYQNWSVQKHSTSTLPSWWEQRSLALSTHPCHWPGLWSTISQETPSSSQNTPKKPSSSSFILLPFTPQRSLPLTSKLHSLLQRMLPLFQLVRCIAHQSCSLEKKPGVLCSLM